MTEPTCRTCYLSTLSKDERDRFLAEPVVGTIYYCPEHERVFNNLLDSFNWDHVVIHGVRTGRIENGFAAFEEIERA